MKKSLLLSIALLPAMAFAGNTEFARMQAPVSAAQMQTVQNVKDLSRMQMMNLNAKTVKATLPANRVIAPKADLQTLYDVPQGCQYIGLNASGGCYPYKWVMAPVKQPLKWICAANASDATFSWTFQELNADYTAYVNKTYNEQYPTLTHEWSTLPTPTLTATSGSNTATYTLTGASYNSKQYDAYMNYGGNNEIQFSDGSVTLGAYPFDVVDFIFNDDNDMAWASAVGTGASVNNQWSQVYAQLGATDVNVDGVATVYQKPSAPYYLESVNVRGYFASFSGQKAEVRVYAVDDEGQIGDVIGYGYLNASDVATSSTNYSYITIPIVQIDGELESEYPITVDSAVLVKVSFDSTDNMYICSFFTPGELGDDEYTGSYISVSYTYNGKKYAGLVDPGLLGYNDSEGNAIHIAGVDISLNMGYTYTIDATGDDTVLFDENGGTKTRTVSSMLGGGYMLVEGEGEGDWWTYNMGDFDTATGETEIEFITSPLTDTSVSHYAPVTVSTPGSSVVYYVRQISKASVDNLAAGKTQVSVVNGDFAVASDDATAVTIYNLAGQKVAEAEFQGAATVSGADLAKGVYVVKFNNNTVVKVAK